jgi:hypothetical protein
MLGDAKWGHRCEPTLDRITSPMGVPSLTFIRSQRSPGSAGVPQPEPPRASRLAHVIVFDQLLPRLRIGKHHVCEWSLRRKFATHVTGNRRCMASWLRVMR